jgi:predicted nucleotidyltransferase
MAVILLDKLITKIPELLLTKIPDIKLIYLFGSYASGNFTKKSDIDIAILCSKKLEPVFRWQIETELANELTSEIDLVDLLSASTVMQNQIIHHSICIYNPENKASFFEVQVMSMYQHLNVERADILKQHMS